MIIRSEQMNHFELIERDKFVRLVAEHLGACFPEEVRLIGDNASLSKFITDGIAKADRYGITRRRTICQYVDLTVSLGADFEQTERYGWVREILTNREQTPETRIRLILRRLL